MKRSLLMIFTIILSFAATATAQLSLGDFEQFYFDFSGSGSRAEGMGKAYFALSDDVSGASWNPAGIYAIEKPVLGFSYGTNAPRGKTETGTYIPFLDGAFTSRFSSGLDHSGSFNAVTEISFLAPVRVSGHQFVGAFNFYRNYDEYQTFSLNLEVPVLTIRRNESGSLYEDTLSQNQSFVSILQGGMNTVSFSVGTRVYKNWSAGLSINVFSGMEERSSHVVTYTDSMPDGFTFQEARRAVTIDQLDTNKFSGTNFTIGAKYNGEKLMAGFVVRSPFSLKVKRGTSSYTFALVNGLVIGHDTTFIDNELIKYDMPLMVGGGLAYRISEKTTMSFDAEYRGFSSTKVNVRDSLELNPGGNNVEYYSEYDPEWKNVMLFRVGMEHLFHRGFGTIPIRGGFGYEPLAVPGYNADGVKTDGKRTTFSLGTGIHWEQIRFDIAYSYISSDQDQNLFLNEAYISPVNENRDHHINVSFTGVF